MKTESPHLESSRRAFLRRTTATAALAGMSAQFPWIAQSAVGANDRIGIALIGCGGRGNHLLGQCLQRREKANLHFPALCDVWRVNLESTAATVRTKTGSAPKTFTRYEEVLALPEVDAVIIATPDFGHSPILRDAARAKKHAYVEKPMANRIEDANAAVDAVVENKIVCQVGTQRRSEGRFIRAAELFQSGLLGQLVKAECGWHDHGPRWQRGFAEVKAEDVDWEQYLMGLPRETFDARKFRCWHLYKDLTVGMVGLLGSHLMDVATWFANDPLPLTAAGMGAHVVWKEREHFDLQECLFHFPTGFVLQCNSRLGNSYIPAENFFFGTKGIFDTSSWTFRGDGGGAGKLPEPVKVTPSASPDHMQNWIDCMRAGNAKTNADVHAGYAHSVASIMGSMACDLRRQVRFVPEKRALVPV